MQILRPHSTFKITWVTSDPNDNTTYYPQAIIRNSLTGAILDTGTVNLTLESNGRYSVNWFVPDDQSGQGTQVDVTVTVYTDANHTVLSAVYQRENRIYNIFDLPAQLLKTGGGDNTDYNEIRRIVRREVEAMAGSFPKIPDYADSLTGIAGMADSIRTSLASLQRLVLSKDNSDVLQALKEIAAHSNLLKQIAAAIQRVDEGTAVDHGVTMEGIQNLADTIGKATDALEFIAGWTREASGAMSEMPAAVGERMDKFDAAIKNLEKNFKNLSRLVSDIQYVPVSGNSFSRQQLEPAAEESPAKPDYLPIAKKLI